MERRNNTGEEAPARRRSTRVAAATAAKGNGKRRGKAPAKATPKRKAGKSTAKAPVKRKRRRNVGDDEDEEGKEGDAPPPKKSRKAVPAAKEKVIINEVPEQELDVYVWGCGDHFELGMLDDSRDLEVPARNVKRPLKNPLLSGPRGITHVALGARHGAALVKTPENNGNRILTWGSNEYGALGRITEARPRFAAMRDDWRRYRALPDVEKEPEWTPGLVDVDVMGEELRFSQLACGAETTFALTDAGDVYGWGCFMRKAPLDLPKDYEFRLENMSEKKLIGFSENVLVQEFPIKLPGLKNIRSIVAGDNHVLALDEKGKLYVWGSDEQGQLGHRRMARRDKQYLKPALFRQRNSFRMVGTGKNHCFAIQEKHDRVWGWGQNDFCQTGTENDTGAVCVPAPVPALSAFSIDGDHIERITGTDISSIASISNGKTLVWGCLEPNMTGHDPNSLDPTEFIRNSDEWPVILITPTQIMRVAKSPTFAAGGRTHSILVRTDNGRAFSWGENHVYQCGQGHTDDVVEPKRLITAREDRQRGWVWAGAGHQFGMLAAHTRNTMRWERSRNEPGSPASAMDGQAGSPKENASSIFVSDETRSSGESPASAQVEPSRGSAESSSVASRTRHSGGSGGSTAPGTVDGARTPRAQVGMREPEFGRMTPREREIFSEGPLTLPGHERIRESTPGPGEPRSGSPKEIFRDITNRAVNYGGSGRPTTPGPASPEGTLESQSGRTEPGSGRLRYSRGGLGAALGVPSPRRLTGPGSSSPTIEMRRGRSMSPNHIERILGPMTPSPPPDPQRDTTEIQWTTPRADLAEPGWGPQNRRYLDENETESESSFEEGNRRIDNALEDEPEIMRLPTGAGDETPGDYFSRLQLAPQTSPPQTRPPAAQGTQATVLTPTQEDQLPPPGMIRREVSPPENEVMETTTTTTVTATERRISSTTTTRG